VPGEDAQRLGAAGQAAVGQGRHGAPRRAGDHAEDELVAHAQVPPEPVVLGEAGRGGADDEVGPVALRVGPVIRAQLGDLVKGAGGEQVERREVDEGPGRAAPADLHELGRDVGGHPLAQHRVGDSPVQRRAGRRYRGQRDRLVQRRGQDIVDVGVGAPYGLAARQGYGGILGLSRSGEVPSMDVIVAARLSKKIKGKAQTTITSQDLDGREWAEQEGHNVVATVADAASGKLAMWQRPNLGPWVTDPELMTKYQGIVAAKQDRLSRADWRDEGDMRRWAEDNDKTLFIVDHNLRWPPRNDANRDDDISRWNDGAEQARREWNEASRRYKRMQKALITDNYLVGKASYGYRAMGVNCKESPCRCYELRNEEDHKTLTIHEPEAQVIREAKRRYLERGEAVKSICDDFNARRIPSPMWRGEPGRHWHIKTLADLLRNPAIAGRRMDANGKTVLRFEGIVTWQEHEQLVARLDSRANRKGISPANTYLLTGILFDEAGYPMYGVSHRKRWHYYRCHHCGFAIHMGQADQEVSDAVIEIYGHLPHMVKRVIPGANHFETIARLRQDRNELNDLADDYTERHAEITAEIRRLTKLDAEHPQPDEVKWAPDGKTIRQHWESLDNAARRDWLRENGWKITVIKDSEMPNGWRLRIDGGELTKDARALGAEGPEDIARDAYAFADAIRSAQEAETP
jgi:site-specific DNA recombinase